MPRATKDEDFYVPLRNDMASVHLLTCTECYIAPGWLTVNGHGLFSTGIFPSDAYAPMVFLQSLPVPSEKTFPLTFSSVSPDHSQPPPPLQCWLDWRVRLKREWNVFFARRNLSHGGAANDQHCIIWGCGGGVLPKTEGTFFSLGTDSPLTVKHGHLR